MNLIKPNINKLEREKDVEGLIKVLSVPRMYEIDDQLCSALAEALGRVGESAIEPLVNAISEITKTVSYRGVTIYPRDIGPLYDALANIGEPSIEALVKLFCKDPYSPAKEALAKIGEPAIEPLIEILKNIDDFNVAHRKRISRIFEKIGRPAVKPLIALIKSKGERKTLLEAFEYKFYPNTDKIYRAYHMKMWDNTIPNSEKVPIDVVDALISIGKPAVGPLINILGNPKGEVCVEAVYILNKIASHIDEPIASEVMQMLDREYEEQITSILSHIDGSLTEIKK
jgi:HEAT repeat protein